MAQSGKETFAPQQTRIVRNRYWSPVSSNPDGSPERPCTSGWLNYILHTGARWQGTIEQAEVVVTLPDTLSFEPHPTKRRNPFIRVASPETNRALEGNRLMWRFTEFEPTEEHDIYVRLCY